MKARCAAFINAQILIEIIESAGSGRAGEEKGWLRQCGAPTEAE